MSAVIKMNRVIIAELFDKVISSTNKTGGLPAKKGINPLELSDENVIRINKHYDQIKWANGKLLPKGMEAHIIALIKGGLS